MNMSSDWLAGLAGGLNVFSTLYTTHENNRNADRDRDLQKWMFEQNQEYNSPVNQVARLRQAGLNPNLLYGSVSSGNVSGSYTPSSSYQSVAGNMLRTVSDSLGLLGNIYGKEKARKEMQAQLDEDRDYVRKKRALELEIDKARLNQMTQPTNVYGDNIIDVLADGVGIFSPRFGNFIRSVGRYYKKDSSSVANPVSNPVSTPSSPDIKKSLNRYLSTHPEVFFKMVNDNRFY